MITQYFKRVPPAVSRIPVCKRPASTSNASDCLGDDHIKRKRLHEDMQQQQQSSGNADRELPLPVQFGRFDEALVAPDWRAALEVEMNKPYITKLKESLQAEVDAARNIYPPAPLVFQALNLTPLSEVKVVIIGQDPYHGCGQAEGLSFSVPRGVAIPSSLRNIYKELSADIPGFRAPSHGHLGSWAAQGVLLLNASLTVRAKTANSHSDFGWRSLTDAILKVLNQSCDPVVFLLWGRFAQEKGRLVDRSRHHVLECAHPSGLSAHRGFFGCKHFSLANALLEKDGRQPIDWRLPQ